MGPFEMLPADNGSHRCSATTRRFPAGPGGGCDSRSRCHLLLPLTQNLQGKVGLRRCHLNTAVNVSWQHGRGLKKVQPPLQRCGEKSLDQLAAISATGLQRAMLIANGAAVSVGRQKS